MSNPLVSIIVPTFNYGHFISETLDSVLRQSYENWECLIVDDGSVDNTEEVVKKILEKDKRFIYIYQENKGLSAARNIGLKNSKGSLLQLLDSDDKLECHKIKLQVEEIVADSSIDIVYGSVRFFTTEDPSIRYFDLEGSNLTKSWMPEVSGRGWDILPSLIKNNIMVVNAPLFRSSVIQKVGYFNEELRAVEDWDFWLRCAVKNLYFKYTNHLDAFALVRTHLSMSRNKELMINATMKLRYNLNQLLVGIAKDKSLIKMNNASLEDLYSDLVALDIERGLFYSGWKKTLDLCKWSERPFKQMRKSFKYTRRFFKKRFFKVFQ